MMNITFLIGRFCTDYNDKWDSQIFSLTKEVKMNAIEMKVLTTDVFDITLGVEGKSSLNKTISIHLMTWFEDNIRFHRKKTTFQFLLNCD